MPYFVYILRSDSNQLYIGQTNNLQNRTQQHFNKKPEAAKFTKDGDAFTLVYHEQYETRIEAMHRELQLKGWTRTKKEALIMGDTKRLKQLSNLKNVPH